MNTAIKLRSDSQLTYELKWAAWKWLYEVAECRVIGFEVRLEGPSGRIADVVGVDRQNRVYLVEVKASRADLLKDHRTERDRQRLRERSESLASAAAFAAELAGISEKLGDSALLQQARAEAEQLDSRIKSTEKRLSTFSTKFHSPEYLRAADFHYIMAPHGLIWPSDLPPFWGLLNERGETLAEAPPKQVRRVTTHVLRAVGKANTRDLMKACEVKLTERINAVT